MVASSDTKNSNGGLCFEQPLSYDFGICNELLGFTLAEHLDLISQQQPDHEAVVSCLENKRLTYAQFKAESEILARSMITQGIEPGDRVGVWSANNWRWLTVLYAAARIGAILVNINPAYRTGELDYVLSQSGVKLLFAIPANRSSNYLEMLQELAPHLFAELDDTKSSDRSNAAQSLPGALKNIVVMPAATIDGSLQTFSDDKLFVTGFDKFNKLAELTSQEQLIERQSLVQFDHPVNIQYTSGTTGFPKGVTLSHHNLLNNGLFAARAMALNTTSRFCVPMPFYHCGGMVSSALATFSVGGTLVLPGPYFEELTVMQAVQAERCTHLSGVPTMFIAQLEHSQFANFDYSSLQGGFLAGAPCPVQLMRRVASEMHVTDVVILYGLTEVSPLMTATTIHDSLETRATTVGRAIPGVEVKLIDGAGQILPRGAQGEICCRGHGIMLGYWQDQEATNNCIDAAGWLHSGDLGVMNSQGYLHITGRKKDMIIRGGENIYPREIEEVLHAHQAVAQAQVFGVPDRRLGEEVALWLTLKSGAQISEGELIGWLKEQVAHFKVPKYVKFVSEFPMTVTGKIQKFAMRDKMIEELGLQSDAAIETA
ncbi:MAG: AMP-binding protein [Candidatus Obscuribacterales bacterium]